MSIEQLSALAAWREDELLLVAYAHQFDRGDEAPLAGPTEFDWRSWASAADLLEPEALMPLRGLAARGLVEYTDPDGFRLRLRPDGVRAAEESPVAEPAFVEQQKALRRRILAALFWAFYSDGPFGGPLPAPGAPDPPCPGRTVEQLAAELGEPLGGVLTTCILLHDIGFIAGAPAPGGKPLRITRDGLGALSVAGQEWPLI